MGLCPTNVAQTLAASEYTSLHGPIPTGELPNCSGGAHSGLMAVDAVAPWSTEMEIPKSVNAGTLNWVNRIFAGLMSRCSTPRR